MDKAAGSLRTKTLLFHLMFPLLMRWCPFLSAGSSPATRSYLEGKTCFLVVTYWLLFVLFRNNIHYHDSPSNLYKLHHFCGMSKTSLPQVLTAAHQVVQHQFCKLSKALGSGEGCLCYWSKQQSHPAHHWYSSQILSLHLSNIQTFLTSSLKFLLCCLTFKPSWPTQLRTQHFILKLFSFSKRLPVWLCKVAYRLQVKS